MATSHKLIPPPPASVTLISQWGINMTKRTLISEHRTSQEPRGGGWGQTEGKKAAMLLKEKPPSQIYKAMIQMCMCKAITCWLKTNLLPYKL